MTTPTSANFTDQQQTTNQQTLLEMAITERMNAIRAQEEEQRRQREARDAEGRKRQQDWLERHLPADVREALGVELDLKRRPGEVAAAVFAFEDHLWHLYQYQGHGCQIVSPDSIHEYSNHAKDTLNVLLAALGQWRDREAERQVEAQTTADQEPKAPEAPRILANDEVFCAVLAETLGTYNDDLTTITAFLRPQYVTLRRTAAVTAYSDDGTPIHTHKEFSLTDHELDLLIQARELYRQHIREEAERRAADPNYPDDVPF